MEVGRTITVFDHIYCLTNMIAVKYHSTWEAEARESPETRNGRPGWVTQSGAISIFRWSHKPSIQMYSALTIIPMAHQRQREAKGALKRQL